MNYYYTNIPTVLRFKVYSTIQVKITSNYVGFDVQETLTSSYSPPFFTFKMEVSEGLSSTKDKATQLNKR